MLAMRSAAVESEFDYTSEMEEFLVPDTAQNNVSFPTPPPKGRVFSFFLSR